jgi:hypothetical protein
MPSKDAAAPSQTPIRALVIGSQRATLCSLLDFDYDNHGAYLAFIFKIFQLVTTKK